VGLYYHSAGIKKGLGGEKGGKNKGSAGSPTHPTRKNSEKERLPNQVRPPEQGGTPLHERSGVKCTVTSGSVTGRA